MSDSQWTPEELEDIKRRYARYTDRLAPESVCVLGDTSPSGVQARINAAMSMRRQATTEREAPSIMHDCYEEEGDPVNRMVMVFVIDPDERVPLSRRLLFTSPAPRLTDQTDEELKMGLDLNALLDQHNVFRTETRDPDYKVDDVKLEPIRLRDLKVVIKTMATFE